MYGYWFGKKVQQNGLQEKSSERSTGRNQKTEKNSWNVEQLAKLDPGLAKATAFKNKLSSKLNLETLDPNNMLPLCNVNEGLTACKVCSRYFSPQRIGTHQSICEQVTKRVAQDERERPKSRTSKPPITTQGTKAKQKLVVRPRAAKPDSSLGKPSRPLTPPIKTPPKVTSSRPLTAKANLYDLTSKSVNCKPSSEQASTSKYKRPLSAYASCLAKRPMVVDERVACPTCQRKFNKTSAEHHIPWCQQQASIIQPPKPPPRRKYEVPKLRKASTAASAPPQKPKPKPKRSHACKTPIITVEQVASKSHKVSPPTSDQNSKAADSTSRVTPASHSKTSRRSQLPVTGSKLTRPGKQRTQATSLSPKKI